MDASIVVAAISGILATGGMAYTARTSRAQARDSTLSQERSAARAAEAEAFKRAKEIYDASIERLTGDLNRLYERQESITDRLHREQSVTDDLRQEVRELRNQIRDMEATIGDLQRQLTDEEIRLARERGIG